MTVRASATGSVTTRLPDFLIIGGQRCGTTSLTRWLAASDDVFIGSKEVHFFDAKFDRGADWYANLFRQAGDRQLAGEATPNYMFFPEVPARIAELLPRAKLIAILREPVSRAYSHYWMERSRGHENLTFAEAIEAEPSRTASDDLFSRARPAYVARGHYLDQLRRVTARFRREQLFVLLFEELRDDPVRVYSDVCRFLGLPDDRLPDVVGSQENASSHARSRALERLARRSPRSLRRALTRMNRAHGYPPMDPAIRARLVEHFAEPNAALSSWLGRDLTAWNS